MKAIKENTEAVKNIAGALMNISVSKQACIDAGAPPTLTILARLKAVMQNSNAAMNIAGALRNISTSDAG